MERILFEQLHSEHMNKKNFETSDCHHSQINIPNCPHSGTAKSRTKKFKSKKHKERKSHTHSDNIHTNFSMTHHYPHFQSCFVGDMFRSQSQLTYNSPHGPVTASVVNGTTFYHYHGNPKKNPCETNQNENYILVTPLANDAGCSHSSINQHHNCMTAPTSRNSIDSISTTSSRSVSPSLSSADSSNSARDSGLVSMTDDDASLFHEPNCERVSEDKLLQLVKETAEEVLSDENLTQDSYLLRQMKRNKDGYVSIKLLGSSKKIRKITRSHNLLLLALKSSEKLEVNHSNSKVKRTSPPSILSEPTKLVTSLLLIDPKNVTGIEDITGKFKTYGKMSQIRIIWPGRPLPPYLKVYTNAVPQLGKVLCVTVEFEKETNTLKAYRDLSSEKDMSVALLSTKLKRSLNVTKLTESKQDVKTANHECETKEDNNYHHTKLAVARLNSGDSTDSQDSGIVSDDLHISLASLTTDDSISNESELQ